MIVGTPGGSTIITSVFQTVLNVIEFDMDMQQAVSAKRFHHQWLPDKVDTEPDALDEITKDKLTKKGYKIDYIIGGLQRWEWYMNNVETFKCMDYLVK